LTSPRSKQTRQNRSYRLKKARRHPGCQDFFPVQNIKKPGHGLYLGHIHVTEQAVVVFSDQ